MHWFLIVVLFLITILTSTNTIRCYKCVAMGVCKGVINNNSKSNDNYEIIDCEHYCWKSISLGNFPEKKSQFKLNTSSF